MKLVFLVELGSVAVVWPLELLAIALDLHPVPCLMGARRREVVLLLFQGLLLRRGLSDFSGFGEEPTARIVLPVRRIILHKVPIVMLLGRSDFRLLCLQHEVVSFVLILDGGISILR